MPSPGKRPLSFVAEYQFGDDNLLTATHHEEVRLKNEERVRNAKSILKLEGLTVGSDTSPTYNMKRMQQEQDRQDEIEQHNLILLQRLERIHQHLPKQFDMSHHSEAVQNAPRATNAGLRRRQHDKIEEENQRMKRRLDNVRGTFDLKKLANDAQRHQYFSDQLSKVGRRRRAQETCQQLHDLATLKNAATHDRQCQPDQFYVYDHRPAGVVGTRRAEKVHRNNTDESEDDEDSADRHQTTTSTIKDMYPAKLPPLNSSAARKYLKNHASSSSPTLTNTAEMISASDLLNGFKTF